jgi:hypothetical protein
MICQPGIVPSRESMADGCLEKLSRPLSIWTSSLLGTKIWINHVKSTRSAVLELSKCEGSAKFASAGLTWAAFERTPSDRIK